MAPRYRAAAPGVNVAREGRGARARPRVAAAGLWALAQPAPCVDLAGARW